MSVVCEKHCGSSQLYNWRALCLLHFAESFGVCAQSHSFSRYFYIFSVLLSEVNEGWHVYSKKVAYWIFGKSNVLSVVLESESFSWTWPLANQVMWISILFCCLVDFFSLKLLTFICSVPTTPRVIISIFSVWYTSFYFSLYLSQSLPVLHQIRDHFELDCWLDHLFLPAYFRVWHRVLQAQNLLK